ncbi:MAG TPA: M20/M25/M40 family metallo-hydrolase [Vicinamibacterales bacterium]
MLPRRLRALALVPVLLAAVSIVPARAGGSAVADVLWQIRREGTERSQVMQILHVLTDVYGPRLTGSPNLKEAGEWARRQLQAWGLTNARLEPWDFGHPGWTNERFSAHLISPVRDALVGEVLAWTPSTDGPVRAEVVQLDIPEAPTADELTRVLDAAAGRVSGRIVLIGPHTGVPVAFNDPARRWDLDELRARFDPVNPIPVPPRQRPQTPPGRLSASEVNERLDRFLRDHGALGRLNDAGRVHGQIRAFHNRTFDVNRAVPTVVLRNEDFGRIARLLKSGRTVEVELDIVNRLHEDGRTAYNVVAEIPGTDKAREVVMLGAHLDSWHAATGATDNASGSAAMLEAVRILAAIGAQPRRTIRIALWSGEEQGLLGSKAYVREHFGSFESPRPGYEDFAGYVNIDTGTGRVRGLTVFGPDAAAGMLREMIAPLADLGIVGATSTKSRRTGGTDSTSFNAAGLPGIGTLLDPIEYQSHTWHTNLDTYERIVEDDAKAQAIVAASLVYQLAMHEQKLPRFPKEAMPEPEGTPAPAPDRPASPPTQTGQQVATGVAAAGR